MESPMQNSIGIVNSSPKIDCAFTRKDGLRRVLMKDLSLCGPCLSKGEVELLFALEPCERSKGDVVFRFLVGGCQPSRVRRQASRPYRRDLFRGRRMDSLPIRTNSAMKAELDQIVLRSGAPCFALRVFGQRKMVRLP